MAGTRLGLDLGTNSIGWCLLNLDEAGNAASVKRTGVRIFSDGRDSQSLASLKANRRLARSTRRRRDRFLQRQRYLIKVLVNAGLMPLDKPERQALALLDPFCIRKIALDREVLPHHMGRAIFHINQRRGFRSSRKASDNEGGVVKKSIAELELKLSAAGARTFGEFLANRHEAGDTVRARRSGTTNDDLYDLYPDRAMLKDEFDTLWSVQAGFNPSLYTSELRQKISDIVFFQRPLKPQQVGRCSFIPTEDRASRALPSFQRFRIYQELSNLRWIDREGVAHPVTGSLRLRDRLHDELDNKRKLTFKAMRAILKKEGVVDYAVGFNLEAEIRDHLIGNLTSCAMRNLIGGKWDKLDETAQDNLILLLDNNEKSDEEVTAILIGVYGLDGAEAEKCLDAKLPDGHSSLSKAAIDQILPVLRDQGLVYTDAVKEAGFTDTSFHDSDADRLAYYGKALQGHVIGGSGEPEDSDEKRYGTITNPTVHIALNQVRAVVNEIIRLHGKPDEIVIEIGRDLPLGPEGRNKIKTQQRLGRDRNEMVATELAKLGLPDNRENRQKFILWEQLAKDPTHRCCPFTGRMIPLSDLFTGKIEIEHLLPFSTTLDDSMANKTVCLREANRFKGNRSPFEAFGGSPDGYDWLDILERSKQFPHSKRWRFPPDAMEKHDSEGGFLDRQLNDARYISRYTMEYLSTVVPRNRIWVVTGRLTSLLRGFWGLNSVLRGHNEDGDQPAKKSRDDHRHHAVDAIVVAMTSRGMLAGVSKAARRAEELDLARLFDDRIDPWPGFRDEVKRHIDGIIVSHRARKKPQGQLHKSTAYGLVDHVEDGPSTVVHRVPVESFEKRTDLEKVRDRLIRSCLLRETEVLSGKEFQTAVRDWCGDQGIRSLRILETISVIPIQNTDGEPYKAYKGDSNAYMEIIADPETGKWRGEVVSRFDANQPNYVSELRRAFPAQPLVMRLRIDDMLAVDLGDNRQMFRVQKLSHGVIVLAPHNEANVDARNRLKEDPFKVTSKSPGALQRANARKVHISPTGLVREA